MTSPNRRQLLGAGAALGAPWFLSTATSGCRSGGALGDWLAPDEDFRAPAVIDTLENNSLRVVLYDDASADITDKTSGERWHMGRMALQDETRIEEGLVWPRSSRMFPEVYAARFRVHKEKGGSYERYHYVMYGRHRAPLGRFVARIVLDGPWLSFRLVDIDAHLPNLTFPPPIASESLLFPQGVGYWQREPMAGFNIKFWRIYGHLSMRWVGGLRGEHGWLAIVDDGVEDAGVMATGMTASPGWLQSLDRWEGGHAVRYRFTQGGHVGVAKAFRAWAMEHGLHKTLEQKRAELPDTENLFGGRFLPFMQASMDDVVQDEELMRRVGRGERPRRVDVHFSHADVRRFVDEARALGMQKGMVMLQGWLPGGYDWQFPDVWPPEPALGTVDELRALTGAPGPVLVGLQDNYQDIYVQSPSWPAGVNRTRNGAPMGGGYWRGGQAFILNSKASLAYAERNWPALATLRMRMHYVDTITAVSLYESWEKGNTQTRRQDLAYKLRILEFFKQKGLVLGSEEGADFGIPYVDWLWCRHERKPFSSVPLWPLVFHDAVVMSRIQPHFDNIYARSNRPRVTGPPPHWLPDLLWGYMMGEIPERSPEGPFWDAPAFAASLPVDRLMERIGAAELVRHRILTDDGEVEETEFASGQAVLANFAPEPRTVEGVTVPAGGHLIRS